MQKTIKIKSLETGEEYYILDTLNDKANIYYVIANVRDGSIHKIISHMLCNNFLFSGFIEEKHTPIPLTSAIKEALK